MLKGKNSLDFTNLFSFNKYEENDKIIPEYFQWLGTKNVFLDSK